MILTAHQPVYMPWLGLFHKIYLSEQFCLFDIVQYQIKDYNNRNRIKVVNGEPLWLTVPVESKNHFDKKICDIRIIDDGWRKKHCKSIQVNYCKTPNYNLYSEQIFEILNKKHEFLTDLNFELLLYFLDVLGIKRDVVKASDFDFFGKKSELVLDMCLKLGANEYVFGKQGLDYADFKAFENNDINLVFQDYKHPVYKQTKNNFLPYMSIIDLLFNEGTSSLEILLGENIRVVDSIF